MNMVNVNEDHVVELLRAQAHAWNHIFNFINSMSLKCAIDLGIPDIIQNHGKPMTVTKLVAALPMLSPTKACNINRLMRILVHLGFFAHEKLGDDPQEEGYVLTNTSRLLIKDNPLSVTPFLQVMIDLILTKPWHFVGTWFQNDDPTLFYIAHGKTFWDYGGHDPKLTNLFNEAMASDVRLVSSILIDKCKEAFKGLKSPVDVRGGIETLGKAIVDAFPYLKCTIFDLPYVVASLQGNGNLKYVGGNMLEAIPATDAVLLKWILHDWNDEECLMILKRCKEAISSRDKMRGKVIIIDMVLMENEKVNDKASIKTQLCFNMLMMVLFIEKERQEKEWANLFFAAGFSDYKITPIFGLRSLIEVYL